MQDDPSAAWMSADAAATRLGIKTETLYAYVSRGMVGSERVPGSRRSRFRRIDVERLAGRQRPSGGRAGGRELVVDTELTLLDPAGHLYYRGWDVATIVAEGVGFEAVASWLWTGDRATHAFIAPEASAAVAAAVSATVSGQPGPDRLRAVVAAVRAADPLRDDRRPAAVATTGRGLLATLVDVLPIVPGGLDDPADPPPALAARLWPRLTAAPATPDAIRVLDAALVLLADHELATSTFAARLAASTWADPYLVVLAGLAALGGPLHGGAGGAARHLLADALGGLGAAGAVGARLGAGSDTPALPGVGHSVYTACDPRAEVLLALLGEEGAAAAMAAQLVELLDERGLGFPNVDLALAVLAEDQAMIDGAPEIIFAVARTAGWLAHAIEEYGHRLRFRTRAVYTGPAPRS